METRGTRRAGAHVTRLRARLATLFPPPTSPSPSHARSPSASPAPRPERRSQAPPRRLALGRRARLAAGERLTGWYGMAPRTLLALCVLLVTAGGFAVHHLWSGRPQSVVAAELDGGTAAAAASPHPSDAAAADAAGSSALSVPSATDPAHGGELVIDVAGEVRRPGVYTLPAGSRVADALDAAGGIRSGTDTDTLNRARLLVDGEQIVVGPAGQAAPPAPQGPPQTPAPAPVSLNSATVEQLDALPGIGPVLAASIVTHREESGGFTSIEQLLDVSGIGESRLSELRDHVTL
ncbi:helix-hairpin-helix domain-containing protein [Streptomyces sp. 4N509B]|uniref:helix-hairpin-helix domain-containing protein n=1 Tax=Streptomyces sp. 4N509B TaxID=3457413 RepID=UPI003FD40AD9